MGVFVSTRKAGVYMEKVAEKAAQRQREAIALVHSNFEREQVGRVSAVIEMSMFASNEPGSVFGLQENPLHMASVAEEDEEEVEEEAAVAEVSVGSI